VITVFTAPDSSLSDSTEISAGRVEMLSLLGNNWSVAVVGVNTAPNPIQQIEAKKF
jgi:hypothetical protein